MFLYGVRSPGPGSDIVGDVVEWFQTRSEAEQFIAEVAGEPNPEDAVLAAKLSVVGSSSRPPRTERRAG